MKKLILGLLGATTMMSPVAVQAADQSLLQLDSHNAFRRGDGDQRGWGEGGRGNGKRGGNRDDGQRSPQGNGNQGRGNWGGQRNEGPRNNGSWQRNGGNPQVVQQQQPRPAPQPQVRQPSSNGQVSGQWQRPNRDGWQGNRGNDNRGNDRHGGNWNRGEENRGNDRHGGNWNRGEDNRNDRNGNWNRGNDRDWNRGNSNRNDRDWNRGNDHRNDRDWNRGGNNRGSWNQGWRNDRRYDWRGYRNTHRSYFSPGRYYSPYRNHRYSRFSIGLYIGSGWYGPSYWINDPWYYRLPPAYGDYRWVRYYDDVLLVDIRTGYVVDVIYDFFW